MNHYLHYTPKEEITARIDALQHHLTSASIDGALIIQSADLFYFSGTAQNAHLFVPAEGDPLLLVKKNLNRAKKESSIENIVPLESLGDIPAQIQSIIACKTLGLELDVLPVNLFQKYQKLFSGTALVDISRIIRQIRMIKSPYEIGQFQQAADMNFAMFSSVSRLINEGMTEVELAGKLESVVRSLGHQGAIRMRGFNQEIYYGHLMSGWNLSYLSFFDGPVGGTGTNPSYPQGSGMKKIERNEPIMVDYIGVYNGYMVDQARIFVLGQLDDQLKRAYDVALEIKAMVVKEAVPGANGKDLYAKAHHIANTRGFGDYFMGYENPISFIAHGVGIELDELPVIARDFDMPLEAGMVFALEPKFIFPKIGAVGIEDTLTVTDNGLEQISYFDESIQVL
jgi:Xaa-Pro aminopeptidase